MFQSEGCVYVFTNFFFLLNFHRLLAALLSREKQRQLLQDMQAAIHYMLPHYCSLSTMTTHWWILD